MFALIKYALVGYAAIRSGEYISKKYNELRKPRDDHGEQK